MSTIEHVAVGGTAYFAFGNNDPATGAASDADSTPTYDVREAGAAASAASVANGNCTLLTDVGYPDGCYEVSIDTTGFTADATFEVFVSAVTGGTTSVAMIGKIKTTQLLSGKDLGTVLNTSIASVTSQTVFVLTDGAGDDDAYNQCQITFEDTDGDMSVRRVIDYTGSTKTITIDAAPTFTVATSDLVRVHANTAPGQVADVQADTTAIEADTQDIQSRLPSALTAGGNIRASLLEGGGYMQTTTIATLASQVSFTLTAGSADDDAYSNCMIIVTDSITPTQKAVGFISDYTGASKTVTLSEDPAVFTMAVGDIVEIISLRVDVRAVNQAIAYGKGLSGNKWRGSP